MRCGETFFFTPPGSRAPVDHLWIVVTDPQPPQSLLVIVGVTTLRNNCDQTVPLKRGDHPFITCNSAVFYADAQIIEERVIIAALKNRTAQVRAACSAELLKLVQDGVFASPFTHKKVITFCRQALGRR
jgi:hypothetical protein